MNIGLAEQKSSINFSSNLDALNHVVLQEKHNIQQILLNMPMVKQLQAEHFNLQKVHFAMAAEAKAMKVFYEGELRGKVQDLNIIQTQLQIALKKLEDYKNVTMTVKEIPQKITPVVDIVNESKDKNKKVRF